MKEYQNESSIPNEFYNKEFNDKYLSENENTVHIPAYLRDYRRFCNLIIMFSNYIKTASDTIDYILSKLNIKNASGNILEMLARRFDINIDKPLDEDGNVNQELYEEELKFAILSIGVKKSSTSTRNSLNNIVNLLQNISRILIYDSNQMTVTIDIYSNSNIDTDLIERYLVPNITGVNTVVTYLPANTIYFGFDKDGYVDPVEGYEIQGWDKGYWSRTKIK